MLCCLIFIQVYLFISTYIFNTIQSHFADFIIKFDAAKWFYLYTVSILFLSEPRFIYQLLYNLL